MTKLFKCHDLSMPIKIRLLRCYIFPILLYGVESWTLTYATYKKIEAFEMCLYCRILKISYTDPVTNQDVLLRMEKGKELLNTIKKAKIEYHEEYRKILVAAIITSRKSRRKTWIRKAYFLAEKSSISGSTSHSDLPL
ncbi:unnamed protein product [Diabrotica balteata]|uniref:Reverse transcriptase n=1 Tax=Diabrotica balteata TaxID=107213 RepID=A0A9N9XFM1_DIABA|nr:unnamed protein product [Diabrotica balteata]